jgi:hypothetical protein
LGLNSSKKQRQQFEWESFYFEELGKNRQKSLKVNRIKKNKNYWDGNDLKHKIDVFYPAYLTIFCRSIV